MGEPIRSPTEGSAIIAASIDGAGLVEGDTFVTANEELAASFGYDTPDALVGTPWRELYPRAERKRIESEVLPEARPERGWRGEAEGVRRDGSTFSQVLSVRRTADGRFVWIVRDRSERADHEPRPGRQSRPDRKSAGTDDSRTERNAPNVDGTDGTSDHPESGEQTTRFRAFVETAPVPIAVVTADRGIVCCNANAVEFLGAEGRADVIGTEPERFVHPEHRDRARQRIGRVLEARNATEPRECRLLGLDGEERYGEIAAAPIAYEGEPGACVIINDVTRRKHSREELRRERQFLETVIDTLDDIVYVLDAAGRPRLWNETLVETTGYTSEALEDMHAKELVPGGDHESVSGLLASMDTTEDRRVELSIVTSDGESIEHEFRGTTFEDPETGAVFRCGVARDISERLERERRLEQYRTIVETVDDGLYALDGALRFSFVNEGFCEMVGRSREELVGLPVRELFAHDDDLAFADEVRQRVLEGDTSTGTVQGTCATPDGERIFESRYRLHPEPDGEFRGSVGVLRDVTEREEHARRLERNLDELATLDRINRILLETTRDLIRTADRDVVERTVCTQLSESDLYRFAWVGEGAFDGDRFVPRTTAGDDRGFLDAVTTGVDEDDVERSPARRAIQTGDVQVVSGGCPGSRPWEEATGECGFASIAAIPLRHEDTVYGALVVHTEREDAFNERERDGFAVLGRTVGYIIKAVRNRKLLFADTVRELEFRVVDADSVLVDTAVALDCELELDGYVASGQQWTLYLEVDGASVDDVVTTAAEDPGVTRVRDVSVTDGEGRIELTVTDSSLVHTITRAGGSLSTATVRPDGTRLVVEAPADADVREVVDHVQSEHPGVDFVAQRDRDREVSTGGHPDGVLGGLTDRQREVLEAAYRSGYFAWPRTSTAEEVAESVDLASATVHGHVRKAEETILSALFDTG